MSRAYTHIQGLRLPPHGPARSMLKQSAAVDTAADAFLRVRDSRSRGRADRATFDAARAAVQRAVDSVSLAYALGGRPYVGAPGTGPRRGQRDNDYAEDRAREYGLTYEEVEAEMLSGFCAVCGAGPDEECDHP